MHKLLVLLVLVAGCGGSNSAEPTALVVGTDSLPPDPACGAGDLVVADSYWQQNGQIFLSGNFLCFAAPTTEDTVQLSQIAHPGGGTWNDHTAAYRSGANSGWFSNTWGPNAAFGPNEAHILSRPQQTLTLEPKPLKCPVCPRGTVCDQQTGTCESF